MDTQCDILIKNHAKEAQKKLHAQNLIILYQKIPELYVKTSLTKKKKLKYQPYLGSQFSTLLLTYAHNFFKDHLQILLLF